MYSPPRFERFFIKSPFMESGSLKLISPYQYANKIPRFIETQPAYQNQIPRRVTRLEEIKQTLL